MDVWQNILKKDTEACLKLDHDIMRLIIGAHSKVPIKFLYLETASIPINYILASRRVNYLHNILTKEDSELVKCVYYAKKVTPAKGD